MVDGWRYDFGSFRSGLGLPSHKLCGDPTDMDMRGDAPAQEEQAGQRLEMWRHGSGCLFGLITNKLGVNQWGRLVGPRLMGLFSLA